MIAEAFGKNINDVGEIAGLCEIAHNGTLVLDDIEDGR
jgi:geranylgeranyl pyrophosphate synthase